MAENEEEDIKVLVHKTNVTVREVLAKVCKSFPEISIDVKDVDFVKWLTGHDNLDKTLDRDEAEAVAQRIARNVSMDSNTAELASSIWEATSDRDASSTAKQNLVRKDGYDVYEYNMSRKINNECKIETKIRLAENQYRRMRDNYRSIDGGLLKGLDIVRIDYVDNPALTTAFENAKKNLQIRNVSDEELLLFHGTKLDNIDSILKSNFDRTRISRVAHGHGLYFSEYPEVAYKYGQGLILCRAMPGKVQTRNNGLEHFKPEKGFDSYKVYHAETRDDNSLSNASAIHVFENPDHILPFCVLHLGPANGASASACKCKGFSAYGFSSFHNQHRHALHQKRLAELQRLAAQHSQFRQASSSSKPVVKLTRYTPSTATSTQPQQPNPRLSPSAKAASSAATSSPAVVGAVAPSKPHPKSSNPSPSIPKPSTSGATTSIAWGPLKRSMMPVTLPFLTKTGAAKYPEDIIKVFGLNNTRLVHSMNIPYWVPHWKKIICTILNSRTKSQRVLEMTVGISVTPGNVDAQATIPFHALLLESGTELHLKDVPFFNRMQIVYQRESENRCLYKAVQIRDTPFMNVAPSRLSKRAANESSTSGQPGSSPPAKVRKRSKDGSKIEMSKDSKEFAACPELVQAYRDGDFFKLLQIKMCNFIMMSKTDGHESEVINKILSMTLKSNIEILTALVKKNSPYLKEGNPTEAVTKMIEDLENCRHRRYGPDKMEAYMNLSQSRGLYHKLISYYTSGNAKAILNTRMGDLVGRSNSDVTKVDPVKETVYNMTVKEAVLVLGRVWGRQYQPRKVVVKVEPQPSTSNGTCEGQHQAMTFKIKQEKDSNDQTKPKESKEIPKPGDLTNAWVMKNPMKIVSWSDFDFIAQQGKKSVPFTLESLLKMYKEDSEKFNQTFGHLLSNTPIFMGMLKEENEEK